MIVRNEQQYSAVKEAASVAATVLQRMCELVVPGISTYDLDQAGRRFIAELGAESACYNYRVGSRVYPAYTCLSVNSEIVHGIGSLDCRLKEGDVLSVDVCTRYNGYVGDNCRTLAVGEVEPEVKRLLEVTEQSMYEGIRHAVAGNKVGKISNAVQKRVEGAGFSIVRDFVGHGVGKTLHEEPQIPNFGRPGDYQRLKQGMVLCIEPMVNLGSGKIRMSEDGWTALSADDSVSAHFEHTVLVGLDGPEILSVPEGKASPMLA